MAAKDVTTRAVHSSIVIGVLGRLLRNFFRSQAKSFQHVGVSGICINEKNLAVRLESCKRAHGLRLLHVGDEKL